MGPFCNTRGLALLFAVACVLTLLKTANSLKCYKCTTSNPNDSCFTKPSSVATTNCLPGIQKCVVKRTYNTVTRNVTKFERDCEFKVPFLGGKTECETSGSVQECQIACSKNLCNNVTEDKVLECVRDDCRAGTSVPTQSAVTASVMLAVSICFKMFN